MSIALYRMYRPGSFAELKGQEHVTEPLQQALRNGRVHHAYLFSGPRGCGKTSGARILARSLNCERGPTPEPCGECDSCVALAPNGSGSIDVIEIDAASHGGVDDARELRERAYFAPAASRYKVYVVDEAHMVTREGFNALLKLVEEPPPHIKFVFATTEPDKVIGTIRSRTHHYPFRLLAPALLRELLSDICEREGVHVEPAALPLVVRAGAGSARDSLSILEQILAGAESGRVTYEQAVGLLGYTDASLLDEVVEAFAAGDGAAVFEVVNRVVDGGHDPRRFATDMLERFRDLVILRSVPDAGTKGLLEQPSDQLERMVAQSGRMGSAELSRAADLLHAGLTEMRGATSPRLLLELVCARILLPAAGTDESAMLARLDRMERRMAIGQTPTASTEGTESAEARDGSAQHAQRAQRAQHAQRTAADESTRRPSPAPEVNTGGEREEAVDEPPGFRALPGSADRHAGTIGQPGAGDTPNAADGEKTQDASGAGGRPAPGAGTGELDVAALRRAWPDVLENVKNRRRVAWMILIGDVQVSAVDGRSVTLAFAREGDRKGFTGSGSDRILQDALQEVLGVQWQIEAVSGTGDPPPPATPSGGPGGTGGTGPADEAPGGAAGPDDEPGPIPESPGEPAGSGGGGVADDSVAQHGRDVQETELSRTAAPNASTGGVGADMSGMALIQRELGGQVIEEFDDS